MNPDSFARPYLGSGADAVLVAVLWQAFYDCRHGESDDRVAAYQWLRESGVELWTWLGLAPTLFDEAFNHWCPDHLRNLVGQ